MMKPMAMKGAEVRIIAEARPSDDAALIFRRILWAFAPRCWR